jgi:hypothetical protein
MHRDERIKEIWKSVWGPDAGIESGNNALRILDEIETLSRSISTEKDEQKRQDIARKIDQLNEALALEMERFDDCHDELVERIENARTKLGVILDEDD